MYFSAPVLKQRYFSQPQLAEGFTTTADPVMPLPHSHPADRCNHPVNPQQDQIDTGEAASAARVNRGLSTMRKPNTSPMMLITNVKVYIPLPATKRMWCKWDSLEIQWAINQMGNSRVNAMAPALG